MPMALLLPSSIPSGFSLRKGKRKTSIQVKDGVKIPLPAHCVWKDENSFTVTIGRSAHADLFFQVLPRSGERILHVNLGDKASLSLIVLVSGLRCGKIMQNITLAREARCDLLNVTLGGKGMEQNVLMTMEGERSTGTVDWMFHATEEESQSLSAQSVFAAREGRGDVTMKGVAEGHAVVQCNGKVIVTDDGGGTQTHLTQHVLMLDVTAKVDAVPALEIKTDDVSASHAASVTKVPEEELFYLASRGISTEQARAMYVRGFLGNLLGKVKDEEVQTSLEKALGSRLR